MERELAAVRRHQVYATHPEWVDPKLIKGKRKLSKTVELEWDTAVPFDDSDLIQKLTVKEGTQAKHTYNAIDAPKVSMKTLRMFINFVVTNDYDINLTRIEHAYKYTTLDTEMYVHPLPDDPITTHKRARQGLVPIYRLNTALPGLKQSRKLWYDLFSKFMKGLGYVTSSKAEGVFILSDPNVSSTDNDGMGDTEVAVIVEGEELLVASRDGRAYIGFLSLLGQKFTAEDWGFPNYFMEIDINHDNTGISIADTPRLNDLVEKFDIPHIETKVATPLPKNFDWSRFRDKDKLIKEMTPQEIAEGKKWMRERIADLTELANSCTHDIFQPVGTLSTYIDYPHILIRRLVQRVLVYLLQHLDWGCDYTRFYREENPASLTCFSGILYDSGKYLVCYNIFCAGNLSWACREISPTDDPLDVQITVLADAVDEVLRLQQVWLFLNYGSRADANPMDDVVILVNNEEVFFCVQNDFVELLSDELKLRVRTMQDLFWDRGWRFGPGKYLECK